MWTLRTLQTPTGHLELWSVEGKHGVKKDGVGKAWEDDLAGRVLDTQASGPPQSWLVMVAPCNASPWEGEITSTSKTRKDQAKRQAPVRGETYLNTYGRK